jgi:hypothetical protein
MTDKSQWVVIEGGYRDLEVEVARLLEDPDGLAAWQELKRIGRQIRPAANSPLAVAATGSSATEAEALDRPGSYEPA